MMIKRIPVFLIVLKFAVLSVSAQQEFTHPRGIITQKEVNEIREKVKREPFRTWFEKILIKSIDLKQPGLIFQHCKSTHKQFCCFQSASCSLRHCRS